jgi:AcrR family transcriptional regulator
MMASLRTQQAQRRREQLIDAALQVFAVKGVDGASVKDVAEAAQATPGLLYHYFESKDALVAAVLNERGFMPQLQSLIGEPDGRPASVVLPEVMRTFDRALADNANLVSIFFSVTRVDREHHAVLKDLVAGGHNLLAGYLQSRVEAGELRPHLAHTAASALFATVAIGHRTGVPVDVTKLVELILTGLRVVEDTTVEPDSTKER